MKVVILKSRKNTRDKGKILGVFQKPQQAIEYINEVKHEYPEGYEFVISDSFIVDNENQTK